MSVPAPDVSTRCVKNVPTRAAVSQEAYTGSRRIGWLQGRQKQFLPGFPPQRRNHRPLAISPTLNFFKRRLSPSMS